MIELGNVIKIFAPTAINVAKILIPMAVAFFFGLLITPLVTRSLYKYKMWKKMARTQALGGGGAPIFNKLHKQKETTTPRMGGIIIWGSTLFTIILFAIIGVVSPTELTEKMNFLSRSQTWLPLFTLLAASFVGLADDILVIRGKGNYVAGGLSLVERITAVLFIGAVGGWWFYSKLGYSTLTIPFTGTYDLGFYIVPLFMVVTLALFSGGVIDGIDGLAGGVMASAFVGYAGIAFFQDQIDLAALALVITGAILAFLWFNIPPARFYMGETGMLGLTVTLSVFAFLTRQVPALALIALPLFVESGSVILQILSKKLRGKKIFLVAPIHHHFEALGWPEYQVTMRFWIISIIMALVGMVIAIIG
ncbi:MAG: hypothetical protein HYS59_01580 [Candidatus Vogelbacteria bacterium]|nr:hypothetical protein [Candidatus Vogelbacteria bacterium]